VRGFGESGAKETTSSLSVPKTTVTATSTTSCRLQNRARRTGATLPMAGSASRRSTDSLAVVLLMTAAAGWAAATRPTRRPVLDDIRDQ